MEVTSEDTFECAIRLYNLGYKPVVLDFASGSNPGGGWRGKQTGTQEESLCRRSDLGLLLEKKKYPMKLDSLYYLPRVCIYKNLQGPIKPIYIAVIASELKSISERKSEYLIARITALYETAIANKHTAIVLGAWGLGAFKENDDDIETLAIHFKRCAKCYDIKTVFALFGNKKNYNIFKKILDQQLRS